MNTIYCNFILGIPGAPFCSDVAVELAIYTCHAMPRGNMCRKAPYFMLVGGLEHFLFSPIVGMMIQSDYDNIFQGGRAQPPISMAKINEMWKKQVPKSFPLNQSIENWGIPQQFQWEMEQGILSDKAWDQGRWSSSWNWGGGWGFTDFDGAIYSSLLEN